MNINDLSPELFMHIFSFNTLKTTLNQRLICKYWNYAIEYDTRIYKILKCKTKNRIFRNKYSIPCELSYQKVYALLRKKININIIQGDKIMHELRLGLLYSYKTIIRIISQTTRTPPHKLVLFYSNDINIVLKKGLHIMTITDCKDKLRKLDCYIYENDTLWENFASYIDLKSNQNIITLIMNQVEYNNQGNNMKGSFTTLIS